MLNLEEHNTLSKTSVKWLEIPIQKFNTVVPHFVDILKAHNNNMIKLKRLNQFMEIKKISTDASRTVNQLKSLLKEMDNLRCQVTDEDVVKFDKLVSNSKQTALTAIQTHQDLSSRICSVQSTNNSIINLPKETEFDRPQEQLQIISDISEDIRIQEQTLASMEKIEEDIRDVHSIFQDLSQLVEHQGEHVERIEEHVEEVHHNVSKGEKMLAQAVRYKKGMYPLMGALIGSVLGGPIGLMAGMKLGGLTAVGCGFLGFTGGKMLKSQNEVILVEAENHRKNISN